MSISADFYIFSKRKNSTKLPTNETPTIIDVTLKSGTSLISPTFLINYSGRPTFNYLHFQGRYYFVIDIVSVRNDLWEISCTVDALASWKTTIGNTNALIMYANGGRNDIIDNRIPIDASIDINTSKESELSSSVFQYIGSDEECCRHLHLKCADCGKLVHLECPNSIELLRHIYEEHNFSIDSKKSVLYGRCRDCQKNTE